MGLIPVFCLSVVFIVMGRALRKIAIGQIVELTGAKVESKSVDLSFGGSVFIEKLVVRAHKEQKYDDSILKAEKVYARFGIGSILLLRPRLKEISVKDFVFDAQFDMDTYQWNVAALQIKAPQGRFGKMPRVHLTRGILQYSKISNGETQAIAGVPVEASFGPAEKAEDGYKFNITTAKRAGFGKSNLTGFWRPSRVAITGSISSTDVAAFERTWMINVLAGELTYDPNNAYTMKLRIKDLQSTHRPAGGTFALDSRAFLGRWNLFTAMQQFFSRYRPTGKIDIELDTAGNFGQLGESRLVGSVLCRDVSICDEKFPYVIEHIAGQIDFTEKSVVLKRLSGKHGDSEVKFNGWSKDLGPNWQYEISVTSEDMSLDNDVYDALSPRQKKFWSAFSPSGTGAIDYRMSRNSETDKKRTLSVELLGVEAMYRHFPYPLKKLSGRLFFDRDSIRFSDVVSQFDGRKITINGEVTAYNTERPMYDILVSAEDIPLDSTLVGSLTDKQRNVYNQLDMVGPADAEIKIVTAKDGAGPADVTAKISVKKASVKLDDFRVGVSDVSAKVAFGPEVVVIEDLRGRYGESVVSAAGRIWPIEGPEEPAYCLSLGAEALELNDDLIGLLPAGAKNIVSKLQSKGKVNVSIELNKGGRDECPDDYKVTLECLDNTVDFEGFSYPLKEVTGSLTIRKDSIKLEGITATAAADAQETTEKPMVEINGEIALSDGAFSSGSFRLSGKDVLFDERLGSALPEGIRPLYVKLSPAGRFDADFEKIKISSADDGAKYVDLAGSIKFKNCDFNTSPKISEVDGVLKTKCVYKTGSALREAEAVLSADGLTIKGICLRRLEADIFYDREQQSWSTKELIGDCYGGKLTGKFELKQASERTWEYLLQAGFENIDLKELLMDQGRDDEERVAGVSSAKGVGESKEKVADGTRPEETRAGGRTSGKMSGSLGVIGQTGAVGGDNHWRLGRCRLRITDMQVGKLSPLAKVLYVLKLTEPKDFAFDQMLVDSYIKDNKVYFEYLDLSGEGAAFNGSGWMDLESQDVDLVLFARGPRLDISEPTVLESLRDTLGWAVVRMEVGGNLYDPKVTTRTLPVIKGTLEIFGTKPRTRKP